MIRKTVLVFGVSALVLLVAVFGVALNVPLVSGGGTIYIRANGSIDPPTANITSVDNVTYTFTGNINDEIVVERDKIVVDGAGYTVQGSIGYEKGIDLSSRSNVTVKNTTISNFYYGMYLSYSSKVTLIGNNITANNWHGIELYYSSNNSISGNNITANNEVGILLDYSSNNSIYHNNFINNISQVWTYGSVNVWDDSYPSGGNYWSDYTDVDQYSGPYQNETGSDRIWDHPYIIDENNQDNYPVVPEFPTWTSILLLLIVLTVAITIHKRTLLKTPIH